MKDKPPIPAPAVVHRADKQSLHVIPTKDGLWKLTWMTRRRHRRWRRAYRRWWRRTGWKLANSPDMWREF